ncbi:serine/threonine-protein kinase [Duncaniella dubosii]|uniref:serine/threonine-protein kinase n=1 Tax=Duncaniella dubosii TaxID=2518971 RepID=UPI0023F4CEC1|nr:serine/threonine-protein kinase [Duncaniella dubosii]MCX4284865.1 serine/threonine-protein kinase [Duncaniella dubosii]
MTDINSIADSGELFDGRYKLLRSLSNDGGTADVWLALDMNTIDEVYDESSDTVQGNEESGIRVAIKIYRPKNALDLGEQRFREEFKIVFNCHHTNLVQPINFSIFKGIPYLVLPYCRKGSSESIEGKVDHELLWKYIADVSAGLEYLHAFNPTIVHHDIKPANVLIDDSGNFAITDFGISSHRGLNREGYDLTKSGTMAYMAPERFNDDYDSIPESDIWSFGATLYELISGNVPFGEDGGFYQLQNMLEPPELPADTPPAIAAIIKDCLSVDPARRPSAAVINKASSLREYPLRNRKVAKPVLIGACVACLLVGISILYFALRKDMSTPAIGPEIRFANAMQLINTPDSVSLTRGLAALDTLVAVNYVPAIYEQAFTYGWYSDSASVARKKLLGIEYFQNKNDGPLFLPVAYHVNNKAMGLLSRIEELKNPDYPEINAVALYRLAIYYANSNMVYKRDLDRARDLLEQAQKWAEQSGDDELLSLIDKGLSTLLINS